MTKSWIWLPAAMLALSGCVVADSYSAAGYRVGTGERNGIRLGFSGGLFRTQEYTVSDGFVYDMGPRHYHHGGYMYTQAYSQTVSVQDPNAKVVVNYLEEKGFIVRGNQPDYIVDVEASRTNIQSLWDFWATYLGTATFCDRAEFRYTIVVKLYEAATGDVKFSKRFEHEGRRVVFNLIPVFTASSLSNELVNVPDAQTYASWYCEAMDEVAEFLAK
ncbi:MAG: hypothetical protein IKP97_02155 [Kiritimatiellae bacterium]|nr:hypothetical protein [Kiritimatiellia bacterium]